MKTYPYAPGIYSRQFLQFSKKSLLLLLFTVYALSSFATGGGGGRLTFKDSRLESGTAGSDGAVYRFPQIESDFDALIKIKGRSNALAYLVDIDMTSSGFDKAWQPQVGYNNGTANSAAEWWMDFEMTFVKRGTYTPVSINEFDLTAIDIDGNGHKITEFLGFYGLSTYKVEAQSLLAFSDIYSVISGITRLVGKRFDGPTQNFVNIDTNGTTVMATAKYMATQSFIIRAGGVSTGESSASERMYSLYFQDFEYIDPELSTMPLHLKSFDAKLATDKAVLKWVSGLETDFSHYIVERSFDGKDFSNVTMIFSTGQNGTDASYTYSENISNMPSALVYYRLKMVDIDGTFRYSAIRILKLNTSGSGLAISAYPNPVAGELRITIPSKWQDNQVVYDMFSANGKRVKRHVSSHASQTETLNLSDIQPGTYVIRLSSGTESAVQRIIKSK